MRRLYEAAAYAPTVGSFWEETACATPWPALDRDLDVDVAIIGGGFTGLNAALVLAGAGQRVAVLEAERAGWGASGRNGGFCCLGGGKAPDGLLKRRFGAAALTGWHATQAAAVAHVRAVLDRHGIDADTHSEGETLLAHTPRAWAALQREAANDPSLRLTPRTALRQEGLGGPWHGALTSPTGFALNPMRYLDGLAQAVRKAGAALYAQARVQTLTPGAVWHLHTATHEIRARQVVLATNGYSSEDLPAWLAARTMPVASRILVTRPLSPEEQDAAGWWSSQMAYDSRTLLHYFRLMPDRRFLFGMRGGLFATPRAEARLSARIRADFARLFPAWQGVEITHEWSGLVCLMRALVPFAGPVPGHPGLFAAMGYHGNGVAMGSLTGALLARAMLGEDAIPAVMRPTPRRFPLGRHRRLLLAPAYLAAEWLDL